MGKTRKECRNCKHACKNQGGGNFFCVLKDTAGDGLTAITRPEHAVKGGFCFHFEAKDPIAELNALPGNIPTISIATAPAKVIEPLYIDPMKRPLWEIDSDFLNPYKKLPPLQTWCKMGDRPALPKEGIVTFSAKQKKGKSLSTYALAIPLLSGNTFNTMTPTARPNLMMVFDMEMSETTLTNRVLRQVQTIGEQGSRFVVCPLKAKSIADRISTIAAKVAKYRPDIVIIDQAAKLVQDINATAETNAITDLLDKLSIGRAVWVVMHENKSEQDTNMRGHLGSYLSFAAVEAYSIDRKDGAFTITPKEARDTDTEDAACIRFALDTKGRIIDASAIYREALEREAEDCRNRFRALFGTDKCLRSMELVERIKSQSKKGERAAKNKIKEAKDLGVIRKTSGDRQAPYELTPENE